MVRLISPDEVLSLAFASSPHLTAEAITEVVIISAERKFIRPVVNGLFQKLQIGDYPELLDKYIKPALAQYVRLLILPEVVVSIGNIGLVRIKSNNFSPSDKSSLSALKKRARSDANALMRRAVEHIESNSAYYPQYDPMKNIMNRRSIASEIIL